MFTDLGYENSLRDVVALADPSVYNKILVTPGNYIVRANKTSDTCIPLCSNTDFVLQGNIQIIPNDFKCYYIIRATGNKINILGNGVIRGDKFQHLGENGEWGMGVEFYGATNSSVKGLTIKECWGDCIYIGGKSKNIRISNCNLVHGRRQGISITSAVGVVINESIISNVGGTDPQFAIDIEPNLNDTIDKILIDNIEVKDCVGGILSTKGKNKTGTKRIGEVMIKNCRVSSLSKATIRMSNCEKISVDNCIIKSRDGKKAIRALDVDTVVVRNNTIYASDNLFYNLKRKAESMQRKKRDNPIEVLQAKRHMIDNNKIIFN